MDNVYVSIMGTDHENDVFEQGLLIAKEIGLSEEYFQTFADDFNERFQKALSQFISNVHSRLCADGSPWPYVQGYIRGAAEGYLEGYTEGYLESYLKTKPEAFLWIRSESGWTDEQVLDAMKVPEYCRKPLVARANKAISPSQSSPTTI